MPRPSFRKKADSNNTDIAKSSKDKIYVGNIRKTQLITTFGIGSIVDFKGDTVVIASDDDWDYNPVAPDEVDSRKLYNENLSVITKAKYFLMPRTKKGRSSFSREKNVPAYIFPEKLHCSRCGHIYDVNELDSSKRSRCPVCSNNLTASRFIVVCRKGHMDDFPYDWWVHHGKKCPSGKAFPKIKMTNIQNRSDIGSLMLVCTDCDAKRSMVSAFSSNALKEYKCTCNHPHFKNPKARASFGCKETMIARLRSASGVYFPITKSALLIPPWSKKVVRYIQKNYELLKGISVENLPHFVRNGMADQNISDDDIMRSWNTVFNLRENKISRDESNVLADEYAVLSKDENNQGESFSSYTAKTPEKYSGLISQIAVIDRLTVTQAFIGFSRITRNESNKVDISQYPKEWLPAVELTGEGLFIRFNTEKVLEWYNRNKSRYDNMKNKMESQRLTFDNFSAVYVMLHTFAHLFIREISNICGYSSASIREKIYSKVADNVEQCGVLIYVSSSDSDSSLGGLISLGDDEKTIESILDSMIERARWCSADPLCIISTQQGYNNLNYAACHDCVLLPETSCERFNIFLDRASVIGLPDDTELGFFNSIQN